MPAAMSARAVKRKIRSVGNIKKITRAMQMVSAAKLKKVQLRLMELRPYSDKIVEFMKGLAAQVGELDRVGVVREEIEAIERVGILADAAARHVEAAHRGALAAEVVRQPWEESPVLESLESVDDDDEHARVIRNVEIPANGQPFAGVERELHGYTLNRNRMTSPSFTT